MFKMGLACMPQPARSGSVTVSSIMYGIDVLTWYNNDGETERPQIPTVTKLKPTHRNTSLCKRVVRLCKSRYIHYRARLPVPAQGYFLFYPCLNPAVDPLRAFPLPVVCKATHVATPTVLRSSFCNHK